MNNFIVGQVTPTMLQHLGFGTFVFFGVRNQPTARAQSTRTKASYRRSPSWADCSFGSSYAMAKAPLFREIERLTEFAGA